jgi:hypothetical protein
MLYLQSVILDAYLSLLLSVEEDQYILKYRKMI